MSITFDALKKNYPIKPKYDLFDELGGQWPKLKDDENYNNTCAIRISVAFIKSGFMIPSEFKEAIDGGDNSLIIKVKTMSKFINKKYKNSNWGMSKNPGQVLTQKDLPDKKGIIVYHAAWLNATGHFDLWTGDSFVGTGNFEDIADGFAIELWYLD